MNRIKNMGFLSAIFSITIWSSTYISTKLLIADYSAIQISFVRFSIGLLILSILSPPRFKKTVWKDEILFSLIGFLGIFLYFSLENLATKYTYASNVSVIVTSIPLLTSLIGPLFYKDETFKLKYLFAFALTIIGFLLILSQSGAKTGVSVTGDILALSAAFVFSIYTLLLRKVNVKYSSILVTRKSVFYGWIAITFTAIILNQIPDISGIIKPDNLFHFLFLGLLASGICFITWSHAVRSLGPVRTSQFIYLVPFITITLSIIILKEKFTWIHLIGMLCILTAVVSSQLSPKTLLHRKQRINN